MKTLTRGTIAIALMFVIAGVAVAGGEQEAEPITSDQAADFASRSPESWEGTVTIWTWDPDTVNANLPDFHKVYPNIEVVSENKPGDYVQNIQLAIAGGLALPDLTLMDISFRGQTMEWGIYEDLSKPPYNADINDILPYLRPTLYNSVGELTSSGGDVGLSGLYINKRVARKYLGTDKKEDIEAMWPTWEDFAKVGNKIYQDSGGEVHLFPAAAAMLNLISNQNPISYVKEGGTNFEESLKPAYETLLMLRDNNVIDELVEWSAEYLAAVDLDDHLAWIGPHWFLTYVLAKNATNADDNWVLTSLPGKTGTMSGGAGWGIINKGKSPEQRYMSWLFVKWWDFTMEGALAKKNNSGFFGTYMPAYNDPDYTSYTHPFFGDQDIGRVWFEELSGSFSARPASPIDKVVWGVINPAANKLMVEKHWGIDEVMAYIKQAYLDAEPAVPYVK